VADAEIDSSAPRADAGGEVLVDHDAASTEADSEMPSPPARDAAVEAATRDGAAPSALEAGVPDGALAADARVDAAPSQDGQVVNVLPAWALPLVGTYGKRSETFSYDDASNPAINTRNVEVTLVKIAQNGSELEFRSQLCSYVVSIKGAQGTPPLIFKNPAGIPPLTGRLKLGTTNTFSSEPMLQHLGFDPARGTSCSAGRRTKFEDQSWVTAATCECYPTTVPEHVDDCRVIDGDGDGKPGITTRGPSPLGTTVFDYALAFDYSITIVDGQIKGNQLHELREIRAQEPSCINAINDGCGVGNNQLCPGGATRLIHLDDQATCATLNTGDFGPSEPFPGEPDCRAK
jgi:hypothetical protein